MRRKHVGLFEGIGGFSLAARMVGWETVAWVEKEPFCQKILKKHFKNAKGFSDIKEFDGRPWNGKADIVTGGFPCQPFSIAGRRKGNTDDRYLWDEMFRVVREIQPAWVVGENVTGILSMGQQKGGSLLEGEKYAAWMECSILPQIEKDFEEIDYSVQTFIIPACAVNAPHRRDRVWIIANRTGTGLERSAGASLQRGELRSSRCFTKNPHGEFNGINETCRGFGEYRDISSANEIRTTSNTNLERQQGSGEHGRPLHSKQDKKGKVDRVIHDYQFKKKWNEVATSFCRVDDGLSGQLDKYRKPRLKALGNAIVPQVAAEIFRCIDQYELNEK